jgi:hypothetical protein
VDQYITEIEVTEMKFINTRSGSTGAASNSDNSKPANGGGGGTDSTPPGIDDDNDIPFVTTSIGADPIFARHARKYRGV